MNIFLRELKAYQKSTLTWIITLSGLVILFLTLFPAFTKDTASTQKILENFPEVVRQAFGISIKEFFNINGFISYLFSFIGLAGAVQAMNIGIGILSKEESGKTNDFLLTKPISRNTILTNKILAATFIILITNIVFGSISLITANIITESYFDQKPFILITSTMLLIQIFFLALGLLLSVVIPKIKSVVSISLPVIFTFFIVGTLGSVIGNDVVKYISPFKFYDSNYIIAHGSYDAKYLIIEAVFVIVAISITYLIYNNKDTRAAA